MSEVHAHGGSDDEKGTSGPPDVPEGWQAGSAGPSGNPADRHAAPAAPSGPLADPADWQAGPAGLSATPDNPADRQAAPPSTTPGNPADWHRAPAGPSGNPADRHAAHATSSGPPANPADWQAGPAGPSATPDWQAPHAAPSGPRDNPAEWQAAGPSATPDNPAGWQAAPAGPEAQQGPGAPPPSTNWPPPPQWSQHPAQQWPHQPTPPGHRFGRLPVVLGALVLVVLAGVGLLAWGVGRSTSAGSMASATAPATRPQSTDPSAIANKVAPGLVNINTVLGYQGAQAAGTGMVLTANGEVLTNNHVVEGATQIQVTDIGNGQTYQAVTVGYDRTHDIAVLQLQGASGLTTVTTGDSSRVALGDQIIGIGNAGGVGGAPSIAPGAVTALNQSITATDQSSANAETLTGLIQVNANIQAGDSGGPLVNSAGQVIGVDTAASTSPRFNGRGTPASNSAGTPASSVQGFAIPINEALNVAHQIDSGSASTTVHIGASAMLGVSVVDPSALGTNGSVPGSGSVPGQGVVPTSGAYVGDVLAGGPAAQAGLAAGDVITSVDGLTIDTPTTLTTVLDQHHPGDNVAVTWLDQAGQQHTATVVLGTGPVG